jgi:hypothetical protein
MFKRSIVATLLVAATLSFPAPALAHHGVQYYIIRFYSDSSYTQQVGEDVGDCTFYGVTYSHTGQSTNYATYEPNGMCANDGYGWYLEQI